MVNYLIIAKAVKYLNKKALIKEINTSVEIPDNSLSKINSMLWNVGDGKTVKITYIKKKGDLITSSLQLNKRKVEIFPLSWNCDIEENCIPAGPVPYSSDTANDINGDIPIYAILNVNPVHMKNMIDGFPKFKIKYQMKDQP